MLSPRAVVRGNPARAKFAAENTLDFRYIAVQNNTISDISSQKYRQTVGNFKLTRTISLLRVQLTIRQYWFR